MKRKRSVVAEVLFWGGPWDGQAFRAITWPPPSHITTLNPDDRGAYFLRLRSPITREVLQGPFYRWHEL